MSDGIAVVTKVGMDEKSDPARASKHGRGAKGQRATHAPTRIESKHEVAVKSRKEEAVNTKISRKAVDPFFAQLEIELARASAKNKVEKFSSLVVAEQLLIAVQGAAGRYVNEWSIGATIDYPLDSLLGLVRTAGSQMKEFANVLAGDMQKQVQGFGSEIENEIQILEIVHGKGSVSQKLTAILKFEAELAKKRAGGHLRF